MPALRTSHSIAFANMPIVNRDIHQTVQLYGGSSSKHFNRHLRRQQHKADTIQSIKFTIPDDLLRRMEAIENNAVGESTRRKDASRVKEFLKFCETLGIRKQDAIPAPHDLVAAWASSFAGRYCGKTVGAKICAIKKLHERLGYCWNYDNRLRRMVKGIEQLRPQSSIHAKRAPITIPMLLDIDKRLVRTDSLDICIRRILLLCFFCQLRTGEILCPTQDIDKFNPAHHATFNNVNESTAEDGACNLHLPWSKTERARGDDVWIPRQEPPLDPIHALHKHFVKNKLHLHHPIASYRDSSGNIWTLTRTKFLRRINEILRSTDKHYPRITGHCLRIGGTTFYLVSGVPPDMVKKFGRWRSSAFLEYWRCLDYLGAMHISMLPQRLRPATRSKPSA
jgi:hypothetical protein